MTGYTQRRVIPTREGKRKTTPLGRRIRAARRRANLSQAELARRIGLSRTQLNLIECGVTTDPHVSAVRTIAEVTGVTTDALLARPTTRRACGPAGALKIYIAGPYSAATPVARRANVRRAIDAGLAVWLKGHVPFIPHLTHYIAQRVAQRGVPLGYEDYQAYDAVWLAVCDALLYLAQSPGADRERAVALQRGIPVYTSLDAVPMGQTRR